MKKNYFFFSLIVLSLLVLQCTSQNINRKNKEITSINTQTHKGSQYSEGVLYNTKADGYRGIWYMNQPSYDEYVYKYSGGLGTYCAKHKPFAIYREEVNKTFFCYGGTDKENSTLLHMVSFYDHATGKVPKPTLLLDKQTTDAHDNPVVSIDAQGYIYILSTSHGTNRPSYIHKSIKPYDIRTFKKVEATKMEDGKAFSMSNFSYMQSWWVPDNGFFGFFTRYNYPVERTICFMTSPDGEKWSEWKRIAAIKKGHYQISATGNGVVGSAFNFHPDTEEKRGLNWRTNLYYVETNDFGKNWQAADGAFLELPLTEIVNPALVYDYYNEDLNVYLKDIAYDQENSPVILYITSKGYEAGPENDPRTWHTARWNGEEWIINDITTSDNNYDMGSLFIEEDGTWRLIAPTETGPQPYNPGGEIAMWESNNLGQSWRKVKQLTQHSEFNHNYVRKVVNAHADFYAFWADGHGRKPSESSLYFCDQSGKVFKLPKIVSGAMEAPLEIELSGN